MTIEIRWKCSVQGCPSEEKTEHSVNHQPRCPPGWYCIYVRIDRKDHTDPTSAEAPICPQHVASRLQEIVRLLPKGAGCNIELRGYA